MADWFTNVAAAVIVSLSVFIALTGVYVMLAGAISDTRKHGWRGLNQALSAGHVAINAPTQELLLRDRERTLYSTEKHLEKLTDSLRDSSEALTELLAPDYSIFNDPDELKAEIFKLRAVADRLSKQITQDAALAKMTAEQTRAARDAIDEVMRASERRAFRQGIAVELAIGLVFFVLGVLAAQIVG